MNNMYKFLTVVSIASLPVIAFATANIPITPSPAPSSSGEQATAAQPAPTDSTSKAMSSEGKERWNKNDEKMSDAVRDELKSFNEKKRAVQLECRKKQEDLRKALSPEASKVLEARKQRRRDYNDGM